MLQEMISPSNCALALVDFQPAMFQGVQSHDRKVIVDNVQVLARAAKLFDVPTIITTVAKDSHVFLLVRFAVVAPVVLAYTAFAYRVFRGKATELRYD